MRTIVTRRYIVKGLAALTTVFSVCGVPVEINAQEDHLSSNPLRLLSMLSDAGLEECNTLFPGAMKDPFMRALGRASVLMTNTSQDTPIYALAQRWSFIGEQVHQHASHHAMIGTAGRRTGEKPFLAAGETRLVSPIFSLSTTDWLRMGRIGVEAKYADGPAALFSLKQVASASTIGMDVQAIVIGENAVLGGDDTGMVKHLQVVTNAEHDQALSVGNALQRGSAIADVRLLLQQAASRRAFGLLSPADRQYRMTRARYAQELLTAINLWPEASFRAGIARVAGQPRLVVKRASIG